LAHFNVHTKSIFRLIVSVGVRANFGFSIVSSFIRSMGHYYWRFAERLGTLLGRVGYFRIWIFNAHRGIESIVSKSQTRGHSETATARESSWILLRR
jgi:hypothetical protein